MSRFLIRIAATTMYTVLGPFLVAHHVLLHRRTMGWRGATQEAVRILGFVLREAWSPY